MRRIPTRGVVLCGAVVSVVLTACSSGSTPKVATLGGTTTTAAAPLPPGPSGDLGASIQQYVSCMRAHGENLPEASSQSDAGGQVAVKIIVPQGVAQTPQFQAAANACQQYAPKKGVAPTITPADRQDYLNASACMRSHGVSNFPDPVIDGPSVSFPIPPGIDVNSPSVAQAIAICRRLIPAGLPYSS